MQLPNRTRLLRPSLLFLLLGVAFAAQVQAPLPFQISVNVDVVLLQASVRSSNGNVASGLTQNDFEVFEDGIRQQIQSLRYEDSPVTVGLLVDHSGSMKKKLEEVATAARSFVENSSSADEMFVVNFNEKVSFGLLGLMRMSNQVDELERAIVQTPADGMTALYDALKIGLDTLRKGHREKKVLVVISDGGDTASKVKLSEILDSVERSRSQIYTLGIFDDADPDRNPSVLRRLAQISGGDAYFPKDSQQIKNVCERIAKDIRHQYSVTYVSTSMRKAGVYRKIQVKASRVGNSGQDREKLIVRTRAGYTTDSLLVPDRANDLK